VDLIVIGGNTQPFTAGKGRSVLLRRCGSHTSVRCAPPKPSSRIREHRSSSPSFSQLRFIGSWHSFAPNHGDRTEAFGRRGTHHARHGRTPQTPPSAKLLCLSLKKGQVVSGKKWRGFKRLCSRVVAHSARANAMPSREKEKVEKFPRVTRAFFAEHSLS
jgi:hypothetical protein